MHSPIKFSFSKISKGLDRNREKVAFLGIGKSRQDLDLEAWKKWQETKSKDDLEKLFDRFSGLINANINQWSSQQIPKSSLRAEAEKQVMSAFQTYNPSAGASLATHVQYRLKKLHTFAARYGGIAIVPEDRFAGARRFKEAEEFLSQKFKRGPTAAELSDELNIPISEIYRYRQENKAILTESGGDDFSGISTKDPNLSYALRSVYYELAPEEKLVYEYVTGMAGKIKTESTTEIARLTGFSPSKVSRLKKKIADKLEKLL